VTLFKSQLSQDRWVREHFIQNQARIVKNNSPYFVEIGAHDGMQLSNTHYFEKQLGWDGLCIEPNPETFSKLRKNRSCHCCNMAVSNKDGHLPIDFNVADPMLAGHKIGGTNIACDTITSILQSFDAPSDITYMSIDVEGHEVEVLEGLNSVLFKPVMMTIEHNGDADRLANIVCWLSERHYLFRVFYWDIFAIKDWALWE